MDIIIEVHVHVHSFWYLTMLINQISSLSKCITYIIMQTMLLYDMFAGYFLRLDHPKANNFKLLGLGVVRRHMFLVRFKST